MARELHNWVVLAPRGGWACAKEDTGDGTLYRKELAYPSHFVKVNDDDEKEFELPVDEHLIDHWVKTFDEMKRDGIEVPVPIGHTTDPAMRRGTVERMTKEPSDHPSRKGQPALFCYVRFRDPETAKQFSGSDVSLFMPHQWTSGANKKYVRPIRHVAITDYPVVPALSKFESVAASFVLSMSEEEQMPSPLKALADRLGVEVPEDADDAAISDAIDEAWNAGASSEDDPDADMGPPGDDPPPDAFEDEDMEDDEDEVPDARRQTRDIEPPPSMSFSVPKSMVNQIAKSRRIEIKQLVLDKKISPATAKELEKEFCGDKTVTAALSFEMSHENQSGDNFERVIAALSHNAAMAHTGEQSGAQTAGDLGSPEKSSVVKDAERRAAAAKNRRR